MGRHPANLEMTGGAIEEALKSELYTRFTRAHQMNPECAATIEKLRIELLREEQDGLGTRTILKIYVPADHGFYSDLLDQIGNSRSTSMLIGSRGPHYSETLAIYNLRNVPDVMKVMKEVLCAETQKLLPATPQKIR